MDSTWITYWDLLLPPFYIFLIYFIAFRVKSKNISQKPYYKYFIPALSFKLLGGIAMCFIYTYYYHGGDVTNYYDSSVAYINVLYNKGIGPFTEIMQFYNKNILYTGYFNEEIGYVYFSSNDYYALFAVLLTVPICLIAGKSFIATTLILSSISFIGIWKLYQVFVYQFPLSYKNFAISILFVPSVIFWGSGILKDTYSLTCIGLFTYCMFKYFISKQRLIKYFIGLVVSASIILLLKPYILFALLPGTLIWINFQKIQNIQNPLLKTMAIPIVISTLIAVIFLVFSFLGQYLGEYRLDSILQKAVKTQTDLVRDQYGENSYDIGKFEPTVQGIVSKIPAALNMALFRPFLWDARNPVMLLSGLENFAMLMFSLYIIFKIKLKTLFKSLFSHPLLVFSILFALFFAFSVGLTTANYGALVRLKIPCIPFYVSSLFILYELNKTSFNRK